MEVQEKTSHIYQKLEIETCLCRFCALSLKLEGIRVGKILLTETKRKYSSTEDMKGLKSEIVLYGFRKGLQLQTASNFSIFIISHFVEHLKNFWQAHRFPALYLFPSYSVDLSKQSCAQFLGDKIKLIFICVTVKYQKYFMEREQKRENTEETCTLYREQMFQQKVEM